MIKFLVPSAVAILATSVLADSDSTSNVKETHSAQYVVGLNIGQAAAFGISSSFFENSLLLPVIVNFYSKGNSVVGFGSMVQFRHHKDGSSLLLNEIAGLAGPRIGLRSDLTGWFFSPMVGVGFAGGKDYEADDIFRFILMAQPEFGYTLTRGSPGLYLHLGAGVQFRYPMLESPSKIEWNELGMLIDYWVPQVNIVVGFGG